ncbi:MAG TPA: hypothetical protein VFQ44_20160 [Streptosporangiaceae bacterium]|nr:hypothetical protein [Streptosporangiaceae bacterium]
MNGAPPGAVITGLGMTRLGRVFGLSQRRLAAEAVRLAVTDAGLAMADIDGLLICPGITGGLDVGLAAALDLRDLTLLAVVNSFGASAVMAVQTAAQAVLSGTARAVACVFADTPLQEGVPSGSAFGMRGGDGSASARTERLGLGGLAGGYGFRSVTVYYALAARRHMERFGTTSEQLGAVAVAQRQWAAGNPMAQHKDPITLADHQASRWVAEPLHLLDCSLVSNGAIAVVVTSADRAGSGPRPPVHVWGWGQGHPGHPMMAGSAFGLSTGAGQAGRAAMGMAGVRPADITMCQLYDCYTYTVLVTLEDYGFCAKGEGGPFAASGALAPGGSLPVNTGGGQLSGYYMWGFTPLSEAIIQARGQGGLRQSPASDLILVSGNGGILAHHGSLVLSPHPRGTAAAGTRPEFPSDGVGFVAGAGAGAGEADVAGAAGAGAGGAGSASAGEAGSAGAGEAGSASAGEAGAGGADGIGIVRSDDRSSEFFAAAARDELMIKRCDSCAGWQQPSATSCPECGENGNLTWTGTTGQGTLVSWSLVHSKQADGPLAVPALVELREGLWLATGLYLPVRRALADLRAGQPVAVRFIHPAEGESYPVFTPADQSIP